MASRIIYVCDRCNAKSSKSGFLQTVAYTPLGHFEVYRTLRHVHLCPACHEAYYRIVVLDFFANNGYAQYGHEPKLYRAAERTS